MLEARIGDAQMIATTLRRLESLEELPVCCVRVVVRGVRATFFRWGWVLLRASAGEVTGLWGLRPYDVPLRFGPEFVDGFGVATVDEKARAVSVLGTAGPWERQAREGLLALGEEIERRIRVEPVHDIASLDVAREASQRFNFDLARDGRTTSLLDVSIISNAEPKVDGRVNNKGPRARK